MWPSEEGPSIIDFSQPQKLATEDGKSFITQLIRQPELCLMIIAIIVKMLLWSK